MTDACANWIAHFDALTIEEDVPEEGLEEQRAHEALCARCSAESALWRSLQPARVHALPDEEEVSLILELAGALDLELGEEEAPRTRRVPIGPASQVANLPCVLVKAR